MAITTAAMFVWLAIGTTYGQEAEVVHTTLGPIQGLRRTVLGKDVDVYYGIPFARPPVGDHRFKRPEPAEPWTEVKATTTKPNACFQTIDTAFGKFPGVDMWNPNTPMSEDCLYLSIWVPRAFGSDPPNSTLVWIYGGGFWAGSSMLDVYDGAKLAVTQNVIVASMNYRLGPLGFLYTDTMDAPGNQGLLDQTMAMEWIFFNVVNFGGQQDSITIFGESAGAASVGFHLMSPLSVDLFTRAIMQSWSPLSDYAVMPEAIATDRAHKLADLLGCPSDSIPSRVHCLRQVSAENITLAQWSLSEPVFDIPMGPVVDRYFLPNEPLALLKNGLVKDTELLIGANKDEGMYWLLYAFTDLFPLDNSGTISDNEFKNLVHDLNLNGNESSDKAIMYEYVDSVLPNDRQSYRDIADDILGDELFICPTTDFAKAFSSLQGNRNVYLYSYEHMLSNYPWPQWTGVMHGYEIEAVFALPLDFNYTDTDHALVHRLTTHWTRFAKHGNPNNDSVTVWPPLTPQDDQYLTFTAQGDVIGHGLRHQQCSFRSQILPLLKHNETSCPAQPFGSPFVVPT